MALVDYQTLTDNLVRDDGGEITAADRDQAIGLAVVRYSTDRPRTTVEAVVSAGGVFLDLPGGWQVDFSRLTGVELPDGDDATEIDAVLDQGLSGWRIRLGRTLASGEMAHVRYTITHALDAAEDTVPLKDREAVAGWAAALLFEQLASLYSGNRQPTIDADTVDWQSKPGDYAMRAKRLRESYLNHLGIDQKRTVPAGAVVDFDRRSGDGGRRVAHPGSRR